MACEFKKGYKNIMRYRDTVRRNLVREKMFKIKMAIYHSRSLRARGGEIHRLLNHLEGGRVTATAQAPSPFTAIVREVQLPAGYRNTTNDLHFLGNSDPMEFLGHFNIEMDVYQFQAAVKYTPLVTTLANVKQKEGESLTSYFKRFNAESTLVRGATNETLKILLIAGLRVGTDFLKHLRGKDPVSLADVLAQAESFKAIEQSLAETKKNYNTHNSKGRAKRRDRSVSLDYRRNARSPNRVNAMNMRRKWIPPSNYEKRVNNYTPLAASIDHIFKAGYLGEWIDKVKRRRGNNDKRKDERHLTQAEDVEKTAEVKFQRDGSIQEIFGGHPFVGDNNRALERNAREARHPPLTNIHSLEDRPPKIFKGESADITFRERESRWVHHPHNDALVITMLIGAMNVHRVFFDNGSSANILYYNMYKKLGFKDSDMNFEDAHIYGFICEAVRVMSSIRLPVTLGEGALSVTQMIDFKVLDQDSTHNVLEKPSGEVHAHYFVKNPEEEENHVTETPALTLGNVSRIRSVEEVVVNHIEGIILESSLKVDAPQTEDAPLESENEIEVDAPQNEDAPSTPVLYKTMPCPEVDAPTYRDAPSDAEMEVEDPRDFDFDLDPRIPMPAEKTGPAEDTISIPIDKDDPSKVLKVGSQLSYEMRDRLTRFLIKNLYVFAWSHPDMVGIDPGVMCHRLNIFSNCTSIRQKHRPVSGERAIELKEEVDRLLEVGLIKESYYPKCLANPVLVKKPNGKWRTCVDFIDFNKACTKDNFPLPRIDQLVDVTAWHALLSFMDAYSGYNQIPMRDLPTIGEYDVQESYWKNHGGLNPQKCVFGVESGKFLGFVVNHRGIEANPTKIKALLDMKSPSIVKQVQSLTGRIAALNRFVSKSSDRCKEFFKAIKVAGKDFVWTPKCEEAFRRIKELLVSEYLISAVLVREEDAQQSLVYYVSKRLHDAKTHYTSMEKLVYALILALRKLRPYFQAHRIKVRTANPLQNVLHKPESSGRILKWAVELGQFYLEYMPRTTIKGQALADFLLEFDSAVDDKALVVLHPPHTEESLEEFPYPWWILHVDGAVNNGGASAGIVLVIDELPEVHFGNENAEPNYKERLIVGGKPGEWGVSSSRTAGEIVLEVPHRLTEKFKEVKLECVLGEKNNNTDPLEKMGSQQEAVLLGSIPLEVQEIPSILEVEVMQKDEAPKEMWMTSILAYIHKGTLPEDKFKVQRLYYQAARYVVYDEVLYKRGFNQPLLRCVDEKKGNYILREVHEGICGNHSGGNSLVMKVLCQGYYWPTMKEDAANFIRAYDRCQRFANYSSMPATLLTPMVCPWPFSMWGIDLIGELPKAKGDVKYAVVAVDYFTKWAEVMPLATITAKKIKDFVFNSIACRFGIPYKLVSNNGKKFDNKELRQLCEDRKIKNEFAAVYHPQSNGQTEAVNKIIKHTLKTKLEERKGNWPEELPKVMWS
ncbi:uncharacterized protein LOC141719323 [Apium graveolens]|uniref:uncharacterized protein LOC141719323 n=1 Tax=Apium graveolens TaxID=4045 RepID=UPI003D7B08FC